MGGDTVTAQVGGRVVEVHFHEGDAVKKGDRLYRLDTERLDRNIAKSKIALNALREEIEKLRRLGDLTLERYRSARAKAQAELKQFEEEIAGKRKERAARIRLAKLSVARARKKEERTRSLVKEDLVPRVDLGKAVEARRRAEEELARVMIPVGSTRVESRRSAVDLLAKDFAVKREEQELRIAAKRGQLGATERDLNNLRAERKKATVRSHVAGVVTAGELKVGDIVEPGKPILSIMQPGGYRIDIGVISNKVGALRLGMRVRVKLDAYDYQKYGTMQGTIFHISEDSKVQDGRIYYVVKIALKGKEVAKGNHRGKIKLGMTGRVEILTGQESVLTVFTKKIRNSLSFN